MRGVFPISGVPRTPVVTWVLLAVNVLIWLAMENRGGSRDTEVLLDFGAMFGPLIADGEYRRLFMAMFLHVGLVHLLFNVFGLFIFGRVVERIYGHLSFIAIYVLAGLSGSVASYIFNSIAIGAGASGAIFGILGAFAAFFTVRRGVLGEMGRQNLSGILFMVAINLFFGFVTPGIDNWAHMGGFIAGFALGLALVPGSSPIQVSSGMVHPLAKAYHLPLLLRQLLVVLVMITVLTCGMWVGTITLEDNSHSHIYKANRYLERQEYVMALKEIDEVVRIDPLVGDAYYLRGKVLVGLGDLTAAQAELSKAIRLGLDAETMQEAVAMLVWIRATK